MKNIETEKELLYLIKYYLLVFKDITRPNNFYELCKITGLSEKELSIYINILVNSGEINPSLFYNSKILKKQKEEIYEFNTPSNSFQICFMSDKHIGHTDDDIKAVHAAYEEAERRGVDLVFDLGDLLNGPIEKAKSKEKVRIGSLEESLKEANNFHQSVIPTYFITGNHDLGFMKTHRCDIGNLMEQECNNLYFLNDLFAPIEVNGLKINLSHGYIEQRYLRFINLQRENKFLTINNPDLIMQGHFHIYSLSKKNGILLYQIPGLKQNGKTKKSSADKCRVGAVYLSIEKFKDHFEIREEEVDLQKPKKLTKVIEYSYKR